MTDKKIFTIKKIIMKQRPVIDLKRPRDREHGVD